MEERVRRLEQDIMKLKSAYDQYFAGVERRPPDQLAQRVAREVRTLTSTVITNTALRFRNQQVISRYNTYLQYWQRNLRDLEEGRKPRRRVTGPEGELSAPLAAGSQDAAAGGGDEIDRLYSAVTREYERLGNGRVPDRDKIRNAVEQQTRAIREKYGSEEIAFSVVTDGGKIKIKAGLASRRKP